MRKVALLVEPGIRTPDAQGNGIDTPYFTCTLRSRTKVDMVHFLFSAFSILRASFPRLFCFYRRRVHFENQIQRIKLMKSLCKDNEGFKDTTVSVANDSKSLCVVSQMEMPFRGAHFDALSSGIPILIFSQHAPNAARELCDFCINSDIDSGTHQMVGAVLSKFDQVIASVINDDPDLGSDVLFFGRRAVVTELRSSFASLDLTHLQTREQLVDFISR